MTVYFFSLNSFVLQNHNELHIRNLAWRCSIRDPFHCVAHHIKFVLKRVEMHVNHF